MYEITFQPFIGKDYHTQSPKILIVGESHYAGEGDENQAAFTEYVVRRFAKRENGERRAFWTIIAKAIDNQLNNNTATELWDKVAFYNYVQILVGKGPRIRPTEEMFNNSKQALKQVLDQLKPDIVIVLGRQLSRHIDYHKEYFGQSLADTIVCNWTHPSTPRHFKAKEAIQSLEDARSQFLTLSN